MIEMRCEAGYWAGHRDMLQTAGWFKGQLHMPAAR